MARGRPAKVFLTLEAAREHGKKLGGTFRYFQKFDDVYTKRLIGWTYERIEMGQDVHGDSNSNSKAVKRIKT
mgnify:CR=1 FL=1|jgi:hypothetical protein